MNVEKIRRKNNEEHKSREQTAHLNDYKEATVKIKCEKHLEDEKYGCGLRYKS